MALSPREFKLQFLASEEGAGIKRQLEAMVKDPGYNTRSHYSPDGGLIGFVDKHMRYLSEHPKLKPSEYLANIRLMTKLRS